MRLWTYTRPFVHNDDNYEVKFYFSLTDYTSALYYNGHLVDQQTCAFVAGMRVIEHKFKPDHSTTEISVSVGYYSWWSICIEVYEGERLLYASHPGKDVYFAAKKMEKLAPNDTTSATDYSKKMHEQSQKWQRNKPSIFADIGLGLSFFIVAKVTDDLTIAAFTGVVLGLLLVIIQRFVKADLLGGFAVFGTIMLLISGLFSVAFQSEYLVQIKGTIMGGLSATILLIDGIFRQGRYFGARFERYLSSPVDHQFFVVGLALIGVVMAGINYCIASYLSKDTWLTYSTFIDTPVYIVLFLLLIYQSEKKLKQKQLD